MKLELLGVSGGNTADHALTGFLVNDFLAVDAGALTQRLSLERQLGISDILISHAHLDHTLSLPFLVDNLFSELDEPLTVWASAACIKAMKEHLFNNLTWPDFTVLPTPEQPVLRFCELKPEIPVEIKGLTVTAVPVNHIVPTTGFLVESNSSGACFAYTADTCSTDRIWELANQKPCLKAVIVDCSFPNVLRGLALASGHMTPELLGEDIKKLQADCPVVVYHLKPNYVEDLERELDAVKDPRLIFRDVQGRRLDLTAPEIRA